MKISRQLKTDIVGYTFIAPNLIGFLIFTLFPVAFSVVISFTDWDYTQGFNSMTFNWGNNFVEMWKDEWFVASLINTFYFSFAVVPATVFIALVLAVVIDKYVIGKTPVRLAMFMPYISNIVALSIVWVMMYSPYGPITQLVQSLGVENPPKWLGDFNWAMPAIIVMSIWAGVGYCIMIYTSAIQSLPTEQYEAAEIDGASEVQKFFKITIPMLSPTTFFLVITTFIASFQVFGQIMIMTRGGPGTSTSVLVHYVYTTAFSFYRMGYAAAISWILFIVLFIITIIQWQGQKKWVSYT
ncbi:sugar ABC transporter permease [Paenibacillus sp. FSL R10-2734]|uniref:carbohydrate ABC transporter permease n=1 Tax=Paenibacillus sp. FSL R10-2734 TaxID=2954691 RepID=UPI0030D99B62